MDAEAFQQGSYNTKVIQLSSVHPNCVTQHHSASLDPFLGTNSTFAIDAVARAVIRTETEGISSPY